MAVYENNIIIFFFFFLGGGWGGGGCGGEVGTGWAGALYGHNFTYFLSGHGRLWT